MTFANSIICQSYFGKADLWEKTRAAETDNSVLLHEMDYKYNPSHRLELD